MWFDRPLRQTNECEILHFLRHAFENKLLFFMKTNLIKARGTHTLTHGLGMVLALKGVLSLPSAASGSLRHGFPPSIDPTVLSC